ncbi:hypothetical protein [Streptomyces sp. enrichment culture]|uniref:hypothetical protein n=1 Tax=Streptomyces sp. enrichment culture TaxID=1795815 RepID=UPI003F57F203
MNVRHTAAWVGVTAAALLATTACGADKAADAADSADMIMAALTRATDRTEEVGSAEVRMTTDLGQGEPIAMEGVYSWGDGFAFDVEMDTEAAQMQTLTDSPTVRTLFVDGVYYYDIDPQPSGPLAGKEWMSIDSSAIFGEEGAQAFSGGGGTSPTASMKGLKYADDVENLGEQTVNGKETTHYRAVVSEKQMGKFKDAYADEGNLFSSMTGGADSVTMEVWVGEDDLPVRMVQEIGATKISMDFDKFGATTEVKAPPAAQTGDLTDEIKAQQPTA